MLEVGQLHPFSLYLREDEVPPEPSSVFVGCGRVFEVPPTHRKKLAKLAKFRFYRPFCRFEVGQLGQLHLFSLHLREGDPKRAKKSGNINTIEHKLTKGTMEFGRKPPHRAFRTVLAAYSLSAFSSLRYLRVLLFKLFSSVLLSSRATKIGVTVRSSSIDFDHSP